MIRDLENTFKFFFSLNIFPRSKFLFLVVYSNRDGC